MLLSDRVCFQVSSPRPGGANAAFSVEAVWSQVARTLGGQWGEWERLCEACYGADVALNLSTEQVMEIMSEEAEAMAKAAASAAVATAATVNVVATASAASKWQRKAQAHQQQQQAGDRPSVESAGSDESSRVSTLSV